MSKVLFFDIDGTLISNHEGYSEIDSKVLEKFEEMKNDGHHLFIATGRPFAFVNEYIASVGFDGYVMANGSHVMIDGKTIFENCLGENKVRRIVEFLDSRGVEYILQDNRYGYLDPKFERMLEFYRTCTIKEDHLVFDFDDSIYSKIIKMEINMEPEMEAEMIEFLGDEYNYDFNGTVNLFEVYSKGITKAEGIAKALDHYRLAIEDSYAFGDGHNDIAMIKAAGCGVVMGNGVDELKQVGDYITDDFKDDGLINALNRFF